MELSKDFDNINHELSFAKLYAYIFSKVLKFMFKKARLLNRFFPGLHYYQGRHSYLF